MSENPKPKRFLRALRNTLNFTLIALLLLAMCGRIVRDRNLVFALMMYLPMFPFACAAIVVDLAQRGRSVRKARFSLAILGAVGLFWSLNSLIAHGTPSPAPANAITFLQMNVQWGGYEHEETWTKISDTLASKHPQIIAMSEAPFDARLKRLCQKLGPEWSFVTHTNQTPSRYWFKIAILSQCHLTREETVDLPHGGAMIVLVEAPKPIRILIVDGISNPLVPRTPLLNAIVERSRRDPPVDIIAGDFNSIRNSVGFDDFRNDYSLASDLARGWRATFPQPLPLYDIDHVWIRTSLHASSDEFFSSPGTNHRGQIVNLAP